MRLLRPWVALVWAVGCASGPVVVKSQPKPASVDVQARVFNVSLDKAKALVRALLDHRGIHLFDTADANILITSPKKTAIEHETLVPTGDGLLLGNESIYTDERTWMVIFEPKSPTSTAIRVVRGENLAMTNAAERSTTMDSAMAPVKIDARIPPNFVRDREEEAVVAAELDSQVAVEVAEGHGELEDPMVTPLEDPQTVSALVTEPPRCRIDQQPLGNLLNEGHFLLMSDPLGAQEPWAVVDDVLCLADARHLSVTLALSMPAAEQRALNTYLESSGSKRDREQLLATPFWHRLWQDGRSSVAVFEQIERVRARRFKGEPISLLAADSDLNGNARQAYLASRLLKYRAQHPTRLIVAMLGNSLTTRRAGAEWNADLFPVGARLAAVLPEQTHTFDVSFFPGQHWTCHLKAQGHLTCGTWSVGPGPAQRSGALTQRPFFRLTPSSSEHGFDGIYFAGALTASVPAVESARVDEAPIQLRTQEIVPTGDSFW